MDSKPGSPAPPNEEPVTAGPRVGDGTEDTVLAETVRRLAYVGMSRARSVLYVIGSKKCRELIGWK